MPARRPGHTVQCDREKNPTRPLATWDRYVATRGAIRELAAGGDDAARRDGPMVEFALTIAEATGRCESSIRWLRWEEIDDQQSIVRWPAESGKLERLPLRSNARRHRL